MAKTCPTLSAKSSNTSGLSLMIFPRLPARFDEFILGGGDSEILSERE
jgi:hypothetical protein